MQILGVDPGIARTGWGLIEEKNGGAHALAYGCIETKLSLSTSERLQVIYDSISQLFSKYNPDVMSIEELFFNTNTKTALTVGQARGVVLLISAQKKLPLFVYTPLQVKIAMTGYGRAEKNQIGQMVKLLLKLDSVPKPDDTADALAIALTHAFQRKMGGYKK